MREKIHMEYHEDKKCPCGFDFTEEERQETKERLLAEKINGNRVEQVKSVVSGTRQETHQPRKHAQETYPRLNDKQKIGQHQEVPRFMGHLDRYLNAPYGQHPMLPIPTQQSFHPYHPQHAFIGSQVRPMNQYRGKHTTFPFFNGTNMNSDPVMAFGGPFVRNQETRDAGTPDQNLAEDQPVQDLPAENEISLVTEESSPDTVEFILSPVDVSSGVVLPSRPHSCRRYEPAVEWDTMSL
jgi:hypothetical protein